MCSNQKPLQSVKVVMFKLNKYETQIEETEYV